MKKRYRQGVLQRMLVAVLVSLPFVNTPVNGIGSPNSDELPVIVVQSGHQAGITAMTFSPHHEIFSSADENGTVKVWEISTGRLLRTLQDTAYMVWSIAYSSDGRLLAAGSGDHIARIWEVESGRLLKAMKGHVHRVSAVAFSPDNRKLATGSIAHREDLETALIALWDVESGRQLLHINGGGGTVRDLAFLPDGNTLVVADAGKVRICDLKARRFITEVEAPMLINIVVSHGGSFLAANLERGFTVWALPSLKPLSSLRERAMDNRVLAFTDDDKSVMTTDGRVIEFFDLNSGTRTKVLQIDSTVRFAPALWHSKVFGRFTRWAAPVAVSSNARWLAYALRNKPIGLLDLVSASLSKKTSQESIIVRDVQFSADAKVLSAGLGDGTTKVWGMNLGRPVRSLKGHDATVHSVGFGPSGQVLSTAGYDNSLVLWDLSSGKELKRVTVSGYYEQVPGFDPHESERFGDRSELHTYRRSVAPPRAPRIGLGRIPQTIFTSAFSPIEQLVACGGYDGYVNIFDLKNKRDFNLYKSNYKESGFVNKLLFSPDGNTLAICMERGITVLWDMSTNAVIHKLKGQKFFVNAIAFSPKDRNLIATAGADGSIRLWDRISGKLLHTLTGHTSWVLSLGFSPDGTEIVSGGVDSKIKIWSVTSRNLIKTLEAHSSAVNTLAFSPKKKILASGSEDGTIKFWNTESYELLGSAVAIDNDDWLVFDRDGFFDSTQRAWQLVPFRFPSEPLRLYEPEQFFNQFYQPGLLADILREGKNIREILKARGDPRAGLDISKYRTSKLPEINIIDPEDDLTTGKREIQVTIEVKDTGSGIRDLRVFRNQALVHFKLGELTSNPTTKKHHLPVKIKLVAGENEITAYAFNRDNIKSKDAGITVHGAKALARKGTAYILAVGINQYSNADWNLNFAVNDARGITETLNQRFIQLNTYAQIVPVTLLNNEATKANLLTAFKLLSGTITTPPSGALDEIKKLHRAEPEDDIVVFFSGHGMADQDRYYLIPHDMGYQYKKVDLDKASRDIIMNHSLSDLDLNKEFEKIDAGRIMLIIDACQSGQALESEEKRRGPMNSRGLAQLAYEKGIYILAAAQSYQAAREFSTLGYGLLTYRLIEEGLMQFAADNNPKDGQIVAEEWLDYAVQHVGREVEKARAQYAKKKGGEEIDGGEATVTGQSPRAYYRRERMGDPWVVTKYR